MRLFCKVFCRLIEPDMSIVSQSKKLQIHSAHGTDQRFIACALFFTVFFCSIRKICILRFDIHLIKQVLMHEIIVTLVIFSGQSLVLVQVDSTHL